MAWDKQAWSVLIGTSCTTQTTLNTNSSVCADYDTDGDPELMVVAVRVAVDYPAAPNANSQVDIYARDTDAPGCNLADTLATFSATIPPPTTSGIGINTYQVNVSALDHIRVCVTNPDLTNSVEVLVTVKGAWG